MPGDPNKLSQFWQELKRRKVTRVITVYAAAAFVILELVDIVTEPFGLPDWTMILVVVLLIVGFIIAIILSWIYDVHPEGGIVKTEPVQKVKAEDIPKSSNSWKIATYVSAAIIVGLIAINIFTGRDRMTIDEALAKSIAVLPFHNYSGDPDQDPMCLGLTDEIISHLFKVKSFEEVRPLTSVLPYKDSEKNAQEIADVLSVNYILEGSYKRIGGELRITAQLIDSKSDKHIWLKDYDLPYKEVIGIPAEIAIQIANHLKAFISEDEKQSIDRIPTNNLEAFELMQEATYLSNTVFIPATDQIIGLAQEVIRLDPDYADAYAMIGIFMLLKGIYSGEEEMNSIAWESSTYLEKAISLDDQNVRAITGLASIDHVLRWDYIKAEDGYMKAISYMPGESILNGWSILFLIQMNRFEDALRHIEKTGFRWVEALAKIHILSGNRQKAYDLIHETPGPDILSQTDITSVAELYNWLEDYSAALQVCESAIQTNKSEVMQPRFQANLAVSYHKTDAMVQAAAIIESLIKSSETSSVGSPEYFLGMYYSWIGEADSAFLWLEKAIEIRSPDFPWLKMNPAFKSLKEDPRYWDLYERTGHKAYDDYMASKEK
jgi:TolB-like protein